MTDHARIIGVLDDVTNFWGDRIGTHSPNCYQYHAACLAALIKGMLETEDTE